MGNKKNYVIQMITLVLFLSILSVSVFALDSHNDDISLIQEYILVQNDPLIDSYIDGDIIYTDDEVYSVEWIVDEKGEIKEVKTKVKDEKGIFNLWQSDKYDTKSAKQENKKELHAGKTSDVYVLADIVVYNGTGTPVYATLYDDSNVPVNGSYWIDPGNNKFGANDSNNPGILKNYSYKFTSELNTYEKGFRSGNLGVKIDYSDICSTNISNCTFETTSSFQNETNITTYSWIVYFTSNKTIDPTFNQEVLETDSLLTNVTFSPGNFTHLTTSDPDLMLYLTFDRDDNVTSYDYSPEQIDGTYIGGGAESGLYGNSLTLNGSSQWVSLGSGTTLNDLDGDLSYGLWAKTADCTDSSTFLFNQRTTGSNTFLNFDLDISTSSKYRVLGTAASPIMTFDCADDTWTHIFVTRNSTLLSVYVDGVFNQSAADTFITTSSSANTFVGTIDGLSTADYSGQIDELMVFNRTLNATEIAAIYDNTSARFANTGIQELKQFSITPGNNTINVTFPGDQQTYLNTDFSIAYGEWEVGNGYNETDDFLIASYHADGTPNDGTGIHNGTLSGDAGYNSSGIFNQTFNFDGNNDWVSVPTSASLTPTELTIMGWIRRTGDPVSGSSAECPFGMDDVTNRNWQVCIDPATDNSFTPRMGIFSSGSVYTTSSPTSILNNTWTHITGTSNSTHVAIYVDGVLMNTATSPGTVDQDAADFTIADIGNGLNEFKGLIDEVYYFNKSLSPTEIKEMYVKSKAIYTTTDYVSYVEGAEVTINDTTTNILPTIRFNPDANDFYSPTLGLNQNLTFETFNTGVTPTITSVTLNATDNPLNTTDANLTMYVTATDPNSLNLTTVYNWYKDSVLNGTTALINDSDLLSYFPLNNDSSDYKGADNASLVNDALINSTFGKVLGSGEVDGTGDGIQTANNPYTNSQVGTNGSIAGWINMRSKPAGSSMIDLEGWAMVGYGQLGSTPSTVLKCRVYDGAEKVVEGPDPDLNRWYHMALTWDGTNMYCYVDGESVGSTAAGAIDPDSTSVPFSMGISSNNGEPMDGFVDEVQVFQDKLTAEEVKLLYEGGRFGGNVINSSQTAVDDVWIGGGIACNVNVCSAETNSTPLTILSVDSIPTISSVILNATDNPLNTTDANLTSYITATDTNGLNLSYTYNWYKDGALNASNVLIDDPKLALYYPFDNDAYDFAGSQNGTLIPAATITSGAGKISGALNTTVGGTMDINGFTSTVQNYTFSFWAYITDTDTIFNYMLDSESGRLILAFNGNTNNKIQFYTASNGWNTIADSPSKNEWHHYAWLFDDANSQFRLFVDGEQLGSNLTYTGTNIGGDIGIAGGYDNAAQANGLYDEFILYERVLTEEEISQHYQAGRFGGDVMNSSETTIGDNWTFGTQACNYNNCSNETNSSTLTILSSTSTPPDVTSLTEFPTDPATYIFGQVYEFNATVTSSGTIDTVLIDFDGTNYSVSDSGAGVYNFTISDLAAGTYNYNWFANDTAGNINNTEGGTYTINKAILTGSLTGTTPVDYGTSGDVEGTESNLGDSDVTYNLYRDGSLVSNPDTTVLAAGSYDYIYNSTGGENYTANSSIDTFTLVVNKIDNNVTLLLNGVANNLSITYPTNLNVSASVDFGDLTLTRNGTDISGLNNQDQDLSAGYYNITVSSITNENYTGQTLTYYANISKAVLTGSLAGTTPIDYGTSGDVEGTESNLGDSDVTYNLYRDGSLVSNPDTTVLAAGSYDYIYNSTGGENYTANSSIDTFTLVVNKIDNNVTLLLNDVADNLSISYPTNLNVSASVDFGSLTLTRNGTDISGLNNQDQDLAAGYYNITVSSITNENYTGQTLTYYANISKASNSCTVNGSNSTYSVNLTANGTCDYGTSTLYLDGALVSNPFSQLLSVGTYNLTINTTGNENYSNAEDSILLSVIPFNTSLLKVHLTIPELTFSSSSYVIASVTEFNTSTFNESFILMTSQNIRNAAAGNGNNDVYMNVSVNGIQVFEKKLATISWSAGQEVVRSSSSVSNFTIENPGINNITISYKRIGSNKAILINNVDASLGKFETELNTPVNGSIQTFIGQTSSTTLQSVANFSVLKTVNSPTYEAVTFTINSSAATIVACRLSHDSIHYSPFITRSMSDSSDTGSVTLTYLDNETEGSHNLSLDCLSTTGAEIGVNGSLVEFDMSDIYGNTINSVSTTNSSSNYTNEIALGAGTHLITNEIITFDGMGDSLFTSGFIGMKSTSGTQIPTVVINSTIGCNSTKERTTLSNSDYANVGIFHVCTDSPIQGNSYNISMYVIVEAGQTLNITDESLNTFEVKSFDFSTINTPPIVLITNPENNTIKNGIITINWTIGDSQLDATLTNVTATNGTTTVNIASNLATENLSTTWNTTGVSDGYWNITVLSIENETSPSLNGSDQITILVDNSAPIINISSPMNISYATLSIDLNVSTTDLTNISNYWYTNNSGLTNNTFTPNITLIWEEGSNTITVYANDSLNQIGSANVTFLIDINSPQYSNLTKYPTDPIAYSLGQVYEFNSTWTDDVSVDTVTIEFDGVNYTVTGGPVYNFTISDLAVGTYNYEWFANDTAGNTNQTGTFNYTINQADGNCSLATNSPVTYPTQILVNGTCDNAEQSLSLYRNGTDVTVENGISTPLAVGTYFYVVNVTASQNYTSSESNSTVIVNQGTPSIALSASPGFTVSNGTETNVSGINCPSELICNLYRDGTPVSNPDVNSLANGIYTYVFNTTGNENYTSNSVTANLSISIISDFTFEIIEAGETFARFGWENATSDVTVQISTDNITFYDVNSTVFDGSIDNSVDLAIAQLLQGRTTYYVRAEDDTSGFVYDEFTTGGLRDLIGIVIAFIAVIAAFGIFGFFSKGPIVKVFAYGVALIELTAVLFIVLKEELNESLVSFLNLNFTIVLILVFGIGMIALVQMTLRIMSQGTNHDDEVKWRDRR